MARDMGVEIFVLQRFQVMKDWSDLEERYQDIRAHDPVAADAFKRWMTARFQETVAALEESGAAEKHQLSAMHQQRVQVRESYMIWYDHECIQCQSVNLKHYELWQQDT